jgi:hypothetical protein
VRQDEEHEGGQRGMGMPAGDDGSNSAGGHAGSRGPYGSSGRVVVEHSAPSEHLDDRVVLAQASRTTTSTMMMMGTATGTAGARQAYARRG